MLAGVAVVLLLLAVALTLATRRRPAPQTAADAWSVIPTPPAAAPRAPRTGPRVVADRPPAPTAPADAPPRIDPETVPTAPPSVPSPTAPSPNAPSPTDPPFPPPPALPEPPAAPAHPPAAPPSVVEAPAAPTRTEPEDPAPPPATARPEPEVVGPTAPTPPPTANTPTANSPTTTPPTATSPTSPPPTESSAGRGAPEPDPAPDRTPAATAPAATAPAATAPAAGAPSAKPPVLGREPFLVVVAGPEMSVVVAEAGRRARDAGLVTARAEPFVFTTSLDQGTLPDVEVRAEAGAVLLVAGPEPVVGVDPVGDLVPPVRLLGPLLREVSLPVAKTAHGPAVVALAAILAGDGRAALAQLDTLPAPASPTAADAGLRLLRAAAALVARDYPAVHKATFGLAEDPVLGPTARVLTGAALRADRNPAEALRDFEAALVVRPDLWVARLLLAEACETEELQFPDRAAAAYAAVLKAAPDEPAALLGNAYYVARADRPAARAQLERLVARAPGAAAGWRMLAWVRSDAGTSEDLQAAVVALEHVVAIVPDDASAWADLGAARWRWAGSGGGAAAMLGAAEAFARQTDLAPLDGTAWFRRGAATHQAALDGPADADPTALRARLLEARTCYARALTLGLPKDQAARVHFNLGLVTEYLPAGAPATPGVAATAAAAFEAALAADPAYAPAAYALVAARVAERDGAAAERALARAPAADTDEGKRERAVLEAAAAWARNDPARAKTLLTGPAGVAAEGTDPVAPLARALLVLGYRRATLTVLSGETRDPARLALRVRAYAALKDAAAVKAELARLREVDPTTAADLARRDPLVASVASR